MLTVNELFSGIGAQRAALERLGIEHKVIGISEIDKYAIRSYEAIFGETSNYGDISKVEQLDYADFWTYSFPCTDISVAGLQKGIVKGKTRSGLLYEVQRLLDAAVHTHTQPKYLMLENVKNLVGRKFKPQFDEWLKWLDSIGYNTYWQVLNAKNYGVPQNRERVFAISIRKDIDAGDFRFPAPFDSGKRLKDVLESEVDEKYYLSERMVQGFIKHNERHESKGTGFIWKPRDLDGFASTLRANSSLAPTDNAIIVVGNLNHYGNDQMNRVYDVFGISPTVKTVSGGGREIKVQQRNEKVRKLTPCEYWRLMGFSDEAIEKAEKVCSNSQLYKQAGNSIVVDVLYYIFKNLFGGDSTNG